MKILELELLSHQLDATVVFYRDVMRFPVIERSEDHACFRAGATRLCFKAIDGKKPCYHFAFNIVPDQFNAFLEWARKNLEMIPITGNEIVADFSNWNAKAFYFFDNNGNICECIARFDLQVENKIELAAPAITSVSEIGLVVDDVETFCDQVKTRYELDYFSRQKPAEDFAAIGDDEGLLIIVSHNRNWYPTGIHSEKWPLQMLVEVAGISKKIETNPA